MRRLEKQLCGSKPGSKLWKAMAASDRVELSQEEEERETLDGTWVSGTSAVQQAK